ncbi:MAG: ATP-binding protein [Spirochaetota bacterium]
MNSQFASYELVDTEILIKQRRMIESQSIMCEALEAVTEAVLVLNSNRQIVYANSALQQFADFAHRDEIIGLRPGNLLGCVHARERENNCGTTAFCRYCGAAEVIVKTFDEALDDTSTLKECRIRRADGSGLDLIVKGRRLRVDDEIFSLFSMQDISDRKRRRILERIFFHDILNTVGGIRSLAELQLQSDGASPSPHIQELLFTLSNDLIHEIQAQQDLSAAEAGELTSNFIAYPAEAILQLVVDRYRSHHLSQDKQISLVKNSDNRMVTTDERILQRVLGNMLRNALEASRRGEVIEVGRENLEGAVKFWVHNRGVIPQDAQMQIFQRSFSTKGSRRGLGTYSIKLLTENYLHGKVGFTSSAEEGTLFYVIIPEKIAV